jgi:chromosome segregation ATPase
VPTTVDSPGASRSGDAPAPGAAADEALEALLGRTSARLEQVSGDLALATRVQARLREEVACLERRLADAEAERLALAEKIDERDRLLAQVFASRSWRWTERLRRLLGRP